MERLTLVADEAVRGQQLEGVDLKQHAVKQQVVGSEIGRASCRERV